MKDHLFLALLWISFCALHSILASSKVKNKAGTILKGHHKYYRLYYTIFASVSLLLILFFLFNIPSFFLFKTTIISYIAGCLTGISGSIVMLLCIKKYFGQLSGLKSLYYEEKSSNILMVSGIHTYIRHPLYTGTFLFIWGLWSLFPLLSIFITNLIITLYTIKGIDWEEQKLVKEFGESYIQYQKKVPKLIPSFKSKV